MATRRNLPEDWKPQQATRIQTKPQPRNECLRIPQSVSRYGGVSHAYGRLHDGSAVPAAPPPSRIQSAEYQDSPREPEIVDFSSNQTWHRRPQHVPSRKCLKSPSVYSQASGRQSEVSLGILEYYMRPSIDNPKPLPPTPKQNTPVIGSNIEQLDFGLTPLLQLEDPSKIPLHHQDEPRERPSQRPQMEYDQTYERKYNPAITELPTVQFTPPSSTSRPKGAYVLFPNVQATTPVRNTLKVAHTPTVPPPAVSSPTTPVTPTPSSACKDRPLLPRAPLSETNTRPTRPRNASLSNSMRSRKDSFTSFHYPNKRIPLRMLSSTTSSSASSGNKASPDRVPEEPPLASRPTSGPAPYGRRGDIFLPNASMPRTPDVYEIDLYHTPLSHKHGNASRWSDETCPSSLSTPPSQRGPRTSFTSLLKKEEEYPACFFETSDDEDEATPLRQKLSWKKKSKNRKTQARQQRLQSATTKRSFWTKVCCCCAHDVDDS